MRLDVQMIFKQTPHEKQVMMFSATLNQEMRDVCKKFMSNVRGPEGQPPRPMLTMTPAPSLVAPGFAQPGMANSALHSSIGTRTLAVLG